MSWRHADIQSIAFARGQWTESSAKAWLLEHGHGAPQPDITENYLRYRQKTPEAFSAMRWLPLSEREGIVAIIGRPTNPGTLVEYGAVVWAAEESGADLVLWAQVVEDGWTAYVLTADGEVVLDSLLPSGLPAETVIEGLVAAWVALWSA